MLGSPVGSTRSPCKQLMMTNQPVEALRLVVTLVLIVHCRTQLSCFVCAKLRQLHRVSVSQLHRQFAAPSLNVALTNDGFEVKSILVSVALHCGPYFNCWNWSCGLFLLLPYLFVITFVAPARVLTGGILVDGVSSMFEKLFTSTFIRKVLARSLPNFDLSRENIQPHTCVHMYFARPRAHVKCSLAADKLRTDARRRCVCVCVCVSCCNGTISRKLQSCTFASSVLKKMPTQSAHLLFISWRSLCFSQFRLTVSHWLSGGCTTVSTGFDWIPSYRNGMQISGLKMLPPPPRANLAPASSAGQRAAGHEAAHRVKLRNVLLHSLLTSHALLLYWPTSASLASCLCRVRNSISKIRKTWSSFHCLFVVVVVESQTAKSFAVSIHTRNISNCPNVRYGWPLWN